MIQVTHRRLPRPPRATIIRERVKHATFMTLCLLAHGALAQQPPATPGPERDDLDVTMQIIVDPDAKLPDEVIRRIPLPERKSTAPSAQPNAQSQSKGADPQNKNNARDAGELGREVGQSARERAKEAAEQREQARRAAAEERRRNNPGRPPDNPPGRPPRP